MTFGKQALAEFIATFFYIGKSRYCPGTLGSLAAFPLVYLLVHSVLINNLSFAFSGFNPIEQQLLTVPLVCFIANILIFSLGMWATGVYIKQTKRDDPQEVVIDEVAGQMLTVILVFFSGLFAQNSELPNYIGKTGVDLLFLFILPFGLFRFFDIVKPWPIGWVDKNIKGSAGVMLDDLAAALFAAVSQYALTFAALDWMARWG